MTDTIVTFQDTPDVEKLTPQEAASSLNGWEELAITKAFGADPNDLPPTRLGRALVFVMLRRAGEKDGPAYSRVMGMTGDECKGYFADEAVELDPEDPDTAQGKDAAPGE
jgi:hypothetical protein